MSNSAGGLSTFAEGKVLELLFGSVSYSIPGTYYVAAFSAAPGPTSNTEISGNGYARVPVTNNTTNFPTGSGSNPYTKTNGTDIAFPTAITADWLNVVGIGIYDASTAGHLIAWCPVSSTPIVVGDTLTITTGSLTLGAQ